MLPLDPRYVDVRRMSGLISTAVVSIGLFIGLGVLGLSTRPGWRMALLGALGWLMATLLLAAWQWYWPTVLYRHARYRVTEADIEIHRGVIWRRIINVPRSRVQHTDVSQGPVERSYELSTLIMHTAGTEHSQVTLPGLTRSVALALRDQLLPRDGRDAV
jgi:membrane protein YdbS with pleckstrin-like domain